MSDKKLADEPVLADEKYIKRSPSTPSDDDVEVDYGKRDKALVRKLDRTLLPALTLLYLLSFLDRSNGVQISVADALRDYG